jgi:hypothetical protein
MILDEGESQRVDEAAQHIPDLMDYVMDHWDDMEYGEHGTSDVGSDGGLAAGGEGPAAAAGGGAGGGALQRLVHLHFVVDTCFLCHPSGLRWVRALQQRYAPGVAKGAGSAGGGGGGGGGGDTTPQQRGFVASVVVPRSVYFELDSLKSE